MILIIVCRSTVKAMAVDKNGKLWSGSHTGSVRIWSTVDGVCNKEELMPKFAVRPGNKKAHSSVTCIAYCSATDQMWTSAFQSFRFYDKYVCECCTLSSPFQAGKQAFSHGTLPLEIISSHYMERSRSNKVNNTVRITSSSNQIRLNRVKVTM
jgi:hypothetical protein